MVRGWSGSQLGSTRIDWVTVGLLASVRGDDGTATTSSFALCGFEAIIQNLKHKKTSCIKMNPYFSEDSWVVQFGKACRANNDILFFFFKLKCESFIQNMMKIQKEMPF